MHDSCYWDHIGSSSPHSGLVIGLLLAVSCFSNYYLCTTRAESIGVYFTLTRRCRNWWSSPRMSLPYSGEVRCSRHSLFGATMARIVMDVGWNFLSGRSLACIFTSAMC